MSNTSRLSKLHKNAAVVRILAAVNSFLEVNLDFNGDINILIVQFKNEHLTNVDDDMLQRLTTEAACLKALKNIAVQERALKKVLKFYHRVNEITLQVTENEATIHMNVHGK